jgi:Uma2 family endonuclease
MPRSEGLVTAEEFARIPDDDHRYELVEGRVIRMSPPGSRHAQLVTRFAVVLLQHVEANDLGVVLSSGGFRLRTSPDTVREPDVAFVHRDRIPPEGVPDSFWPGPPDLAVEIRSPGDRTSAVQAKVAEYPARGVRLVWVVDPRRQQVKSYSPDRPPAIHSIDDMLDAADVIPGFTCELRLLLR